ncbi:class I SAM-dependent methyltransferase [Nitrobacter sp. TKz-YC02]|uniref:class I SAM-dependent methyltransferase n=1 Tax=Nitrobacter sp. TKz-YC02 TaxID=3398704 RepID=UPI003CFAF2C2
MRAWRACGQTRSAFDQEFNTDTDGIVPLWKLQIESPYREQGVRYQASNPDFIRAAIETLPIQPEEFVYVDIGSGKGRTLLVASEYPFRRVIGVEFSPELNAVAADNIRKYRGSKRKCDDVSSVRADAANWEFPAENTMFFLYNPFGEDVLRRMLVNLETSLAGNDREIYMVYSHPIFAHLLDSSNFLDRIDAPIEAAVYRHVPPITAIQ